MAWKVSFKKSAAKELAKIERTMQIRIMSFLSDSALLEDPRCVGKPLKGNHKGYWRYRVGQYRIISELQESNLIIHVVKVGSRGGVY